jgi:Carboxypeptidase regulatory-like domain/TonB dependent receptor-like, beta-barrel
MGSRRQVSVLLGAMLVVSAVLGQTTEGTVSGAVTDPTGAVVATAAITALNMSTGVSTATLSNSSGVYVFASLPPGQYQITAAHTGFRRAVIRDIDLALGAQITVNVSLELGQTSETVEVKATATEVNVNTASVGSAMESRRILGLPLVGRSAYDLLSTQPGVVINGTNGVNINGSQTGAINYTTDGINTQDNLLNGAFNTMVSNTVSVDRVEEFRVVTSPADAEFGRGSGQVQMITRGGTNQYHGSAWEELRNTALNANDWFNNAAGLNPVTHSQQAPRNVLIRNQFGFRLGGPVKKNKTFFNGIWEGDHQNQRVAVNQTVYTPTARQGLFRFFPGVTNANAAAITPTVDTSGNPVQPANATGPLQTVSVFGRDPNRLVADPTGTMAKYLGIAPMPNNYLVGDGLNTAGFLWGRPVVNTFQLYEGRVDHIFSERHRGSITLNHQAYYSINVSNAQPFPSSPIGLAPTETSQFSLALTSTLRPTLLNEVRIGIFRPRVLVWNEYDPDAGPTGVAGKQLLPTVGGAPFYPGVAGVTNPLAAPGTTGSSNRMSQNWQFGDDLTWIRGRHAFKGGVVARFIANDGYDLGGVLPTSTAGAGAVAVQGISTIPSIGSNSGGATNLLIDLTGSISNVSQTFNSPGGANPTFLPGQSRYSDLVEREYSGYFKDDFKITPSFTLNLGVRYEWYSVPYNGLGRSSMPVGGSAGLFGISGTGLNAEFQPGLANGSLTTLQLVGPGTPHPDTKLYNSDNNNFAPFVGFAWSLHGDGLMGRLLGKNRTVIRAGYGISYQRDSLYVVHMTSAFEPNGLSTTQTEQSAGLLNVGNITLPVQNTATPLSPVALDGARNQSVYGFNSNLRTPYIQNFTVSLQRALSDTLSLRVSYVGSTSNKLVRAYNVDEVNIIENKFLPAYLAVQAGGTSPLMDGLLAGLGLNSTTVRSVSTFQTYFANNNPGTLAALLQSSLLTPPTGGKLVTQAGLPANFFSVNPQFANAYIVDNAGHSTYNSLQVETNKRYSHGLILQGSYVFSKVLGSDSAGDSATFFSDLRTLRNGRLEKQRIAFNHAHVFKANAIYELPFGPGKTLGRGSHGVLARIIDGWQMGTIFNFFTGAPITFTGANGLNMSTATSPATQLAPMPAGSIQKVGNGVLYYPGITQIVDPYVANITTSGNLRALSTLKAIATSDGTPILVNAQPGQLGSLGIGTADAPSTWRLDANLVKAIRITERFKLQIGATGQNITNSPQFGSPNTSIGSANFGRITGTAATYRLIVLQGRLNF